MITERSPLTLPAIWNMSFGFFGIQFGWGLSLDRLEEPDEFLMPMTWHALADHLAIEHAEGRKQRGRTIALVIVRHRATAALLQREPGLRAIECLDLAFLVNAQDQGQKSRSSIFSSGIVSISGHR